MIFLGKDILKEVISVCKRTGGSVFSWRKCSLNWRDREGEGKGWGHWEGMFGEPRQRAGRLKIVFAHPVPGTVLIILLIWALQRVFGHFITPIRKHGFPGGTDSKQSVYNVGDLGSIPGSGSSLEKETATHSSTLAWKIQWTEEPGRLQSRGSLRVGCDWATSLLYSIRGQRIIFKGIHF